MKFNFLLFPLINTIFVQCQVNPQHQIETLEIKDGAVNGHEKIVLFFYFSNEFLISVMRAFRWKELDDVYAKLEDAIVGIANYHNQSLFLPVFPLTENYDSWMNADQTKMIFRDIYENDTWQTIDTATVYEPSQNHIMRRLTKAMNKIHLTNEKIYIFTNIAERALATALNNKDFFKNIHLIPLSMLSANYYYYSINSTADYFQREHLFLLDPNPYLHGRKIWSVSYLFLLSDNLNYNQLSRVVNDVRNSVTVYLSGHTGEVGFQFSFYDGQENQTFHTGYNYAQQTLDEQSEFLYAKIFISKEQIINISGDKLNLTSMLIAESLDIFYTEFPGAYLPPNMAEDAVKGPECAEKPRIVLITDFVEKQFIEHHLPDRKQFEFHVYSLHPAVYDAYKDKADRVLQLDPDKPGQIWIKPNISHEFPWIGVSVIGGMIFCWIAISITIVLYKRRVNRLNWLNRLERFKSEHIYAAYMKNKCDMENPPEEEDEADLWEMHWDQVILSSVQLGKGVYGEVYKGKLTSLPKWASAEVNKPPGQNLCKIIASQGTEIAIKMLPMHANGKCSRKSFLREIEIMKQLANGHRCLVHMVGCMTKPNIVLGLVLEYCPEGNLLEYVRKLGKQEELENPIEIGKTAQKFARFAWQIADGMIFLASKHLVHRDLAARNVLLDAHLIARICDFGLCISAVDTKSETSTAENNEQNDQSKVEEGEKMKMPIRWMAPESLEFQRFSEKSDVWSFGVLLHELYSFGKNPFESIEHSELLNRIKEGYSPERLELCPDLMFEIMQNCLNSNAEVRPSFTQLQIELTTFLEANNNIDYGYLALN